MSRQSTRELNAIVDMLNNESDNFEELSHFQVAEAFEIENALNKIGVNPVQARQVARKAITRPQIANRLKDALGTVTPGLSGISDRSPMAGGAAAALLNIRVTRLTATIAGISLPFPIFGSAQVANGYRTMLNEFLTGGTVLTSVRQGESDSLPNSLDLVYTNGANVDTVRVECVEVPYPTLLTDGITDPFEINKCRVNVSNTAVADAQFGNQYVVKTNTMFGQKKSDSISPETFNDPSNLRNNIIDLNVTGSFDKDTALIGLIHPTASLIVSHSLFVKKFDRLGARNL